jgi:hypothetical protein
MQIVFLIYKIDKNDIKKSHFKLGFFLCLLVKGVSKHDVLP